MAKDHDITARFVPRFWADVDQRLAVHKEIRKRYEELKADTGADSAQKDILVQRAIFISLKLETMEIEAAEGGHFDFGVYTQATNALAGLLVKLGLERHIKPANGAADLRAYVMRKEGAA